MTDFAKRFKESFRILYSNIQFLSYDERLELFAFLRYYIDKIVSRKFEHNFYVK